MGDFREVTQVVTPRRLSAAQYGLMERANTYGSVRTCTPGERASALALVPMGYVTTASVTPTGKTLEVTLTEKGKKYMADRNGPADTYGRQGNLGFGCRKALPVRYGW